MYVSVGLLFVLLNFDDSEDGSVNRVVLSLLFLIDDLGFFDNEIWEDGCLGKDINMNMFFEVGNSLINEVGDSRREVFKLKILVLYEWVMLI